MAPYDLGLLKEVKEVFSGIQEREERLDLTSKMPDAPAPALRIVFESSEGHRVDPKVVHCGSMEEIDNPKIESLEVYSRTKLATMLAAKLWTASRPQC
ncbi:MAG: hypothetical protein MMC33_008064 [Icmadophila ericetorum]|nr:hypothetical protein [Icmadophila ericetorum]